MKGFCRDHPQFAQCGLNCLLCPMNLGGYCPGCGGGEGNQSCALARCALERRAGEFCTGCARFPCERYEAMAVYDSFIPHSRMIQDLRRMEELGLEAYITELEERRAILDQLLNFWNDGRRKSFYCLAVYLLEPERLRRVFEELQRRENLSGKERALSAVSLLNAEAQRQGVSIKLNKKPKEK